MSRESPVLPALALLLLPALSCGDGSTTSGVDDDNNGEEESYSHVRSAGASAHDFLSDETFTALRVEVDYMPGYAPDEGALNALEDFLQARLNKTSITILTPTEIGAGGQQTYSAADIRDLEEANRDEFSDGQTLTAYMIIVDGHYEQNNVLGIAYFNTSSAFFGGAYDEASGGLTQPSRFLTEATSFRHEFGHLFGLVAIEGSGTEMQTDHQDEAHGHHCDDDQCLMYYAMERTDLFGGIIGGDIPALDQNCLDDLAANGGA